MTKQSNNPIKWANRLSSLLDHVSKVHGTPRFPIKILEIATEYSKELFPNEPITLIKGDAMSGRFEGMLLPHPKKKGEWGIIYNKSLKSKGRVNFTLCHELGHYLMHREKYPEGIKCSSKDMLRWDSEEAMIEAEANTFASYLLMPLDDFRAQIKDKEISLGLFDELSERYAVSTCAAILKWLKITDQRAMIVVGKDGFIDWAWSSDKLLKSGIFYRARQEVIELPSESLAAKRDKSFDNYSGVTHPRGVWLGDEEVKEMAIITDEYDSMTISLLIYPRQPSLSYSGYGQFNEVDSFDHMLRKRYTRK